MSEGDPPPDHLRCKRTDGRKWRCKRRAVDGKTLCEVHYLQGRKNKQKVQDCVKLEREVTKKNEKSRENARASKVKKMPVAVGKKKRSMAEVLDEALKRMNLKRGDMQLELIRVFLKREVEKKERKLEENLIKEETRVLPYGVMAISQSHSGMQKVSSDNVVLDVKVGVDSSPVSFSQRRFRSKNIEPLPIRIMQVAPLPATMKKGSTKKCHWCRENKNRCLIKCLSCRKRFFCLSCIKERCLVKQEVKVKCPVCLGGCCCKLCAKYQSRAANHKNLYSNKRKVDRIHLFHYLVYMLLPALRQINHDQTKEMEFEAKITGKVQSHIQIQQVELGCEKLYCCSNCKTAIVDYHRSCINCCYNLCLSCCLEFHQGCWSGGLKLQCSKRRKISSSDNDILTDINCRTSRQSSVGMPHHSPMSLQKWGADSDGSISCPPVKSGGCGNSLLHLRCVFPFGWTKELEVRAEELLSTYNFSGTTDVSSCCSLCKSIDGKVGALNPLQEFATRADSSDNFLYTPTLQSLHQEPLEHFQKHWGQGHPVIVRNVLRTKSGLCWDPVIMFCSFIEKQSTQSSNKKEANATSWSDWCEVEICKKRIFMGSLERQTHARMRQKFLKFKARFSSDLFRKQFQAHYDEILRALPLPEYMNPVSAFLNLAMKLPNESPMPDLGPCVYISYGGPQELIQADFLTKLCYEAYDTVHILAYATDVPVSQEQVNKIENLMKNQKGHDHGQSSSIYSDQKGKSSLQSADTGESELQDAAGEKMHCSNRIVDKGKTSNVESGSVSDDSDSDSDASILYCGTTERSEDSDDYLFEEDIESSFTSEEKQGIDSCAAQWDIFRRQDVPKLLEYLKRHSDELRSSYCNTKHVVHPIFDQSFFLDAFHKLRLKEEFDIQPWTLEQRPGEAIIIPAGCPYQSRKLKSCVNVVLDFISPENATQCIQLNDEIRLLPTRHTAKENVLEVRKLALHRIDAAIRDIYNLMHAENG